LPIPRQWIWLLNNGIAVSRNRVCVALDQFAIFKCELLHISRSLDANLTVTDARKVTLGEMRESGPTRLLVYRADYRCAHSVTIDAGQWPDDVRL